MRNQRLIVLAVVAALATVPIAANAELRPFPVRIDWKDAPDRYWLGPNVWGNRLHDWRVKNGRLECVASQPRLGMRTVHLLDRRLSSRNVEFRTSVTTGLVNAKDRVSRTSAVGFLVGVGGKEMHPWSAAIVHQWPGPGAGFFAGVTADGRAFIRDFSKPRTSPTPKLAKAGGGSAVDLKKPIILRLAAKPQAAKQCRLTFEVLTVAGKVLAKAETTVPEGRLVGNIALVSHPGRNVGGKTGRYWFREWELSGRKLDALDWRLPVRTLRKPKNNGMFGPIVGTQYTLSRGVLKLTAQMAPLGKKDNQTVELQVKRHGEW
ncbi:MAG: hypothetical protein ACE5KM_20485, partial [Planctomycetaceae bacterium]